MKTLVLPGYSTKNKEWVEETAKQVGGEAIEWPHWSDPTQKFHARQEGLKLQEKIKDANTNIVAKSIGTYSLMCYLEKVKITGKIILCGIPYNDLSDDDKVAYKVLADLDPSKVKIFQNSDDEHGSFEEVRRLISTYNPTIEIIEKPGSTHDYPYFEEFKEFLN